MIKRLYQLVLAASGLLFLVTTASALDVDAFVRRFEVSHADEATYSLALGSVTSVGETLVVDGMTFRYDGDTTLLDGLFTFSGIAIQPNRGYLVDSITAPEIAFRDGASGLASATLKDVRLTGFTVPGKPGSEVLIVPMTFRAGPFELLSGGPEIRIGAMSWEFVPRLAGNDLVSLTFSGAVETAEVVLPESALTVALAAMGVETIAFDYSDSFTWDDTGLFRVETSLEMDDLGSLAATTSFSGLTKAKLEQFQVAMDSLQGEAGDPAMAWMVAMVDLAIDNAELRYEDASLIGRLTDYLATTQGGREAAIAQIEAAIMEPLEALDIAPLTALIRPALREFLEEPSSLTLWLRPEVPTSLVSLQVAAMVNKAGLIPLLGIGVTANQPRSP